MNKIMTTTSTPISSYVLSCEGRAIDISNLAAPKMILGTEKKTTGGSLYPNIELTIKTTARLASSCDSLAVWSTMWRQHQYQQQKDTSSNRNWSKAESEQHRHSFSCVENSKTPAKNRRRSDPRYEGSAWQGSATRPQQAAAPQHSHMGPPRAQQPVREEGQGQDRVQRERQGNRHRRPSGAARGEGGGSASPYLKVDMSSSGYPLLEIGELKVPYIGTARNTKNAIQTSQENSSANAIMNAQCYSCSGSLVCMLGMQYVICSSCYTVSPVSYGNNRTDNDYEGLLGFKPHGVGIGFVTSGPDAAGAEEPEEHNRPRRNVRERRGRSGAAAHAA